MLSVQAQVYGLYHMTNPEVFYNREDLWTVASETRSNAGEQSLSLIHIFNCVCALNSGLCQDLRVRCGW